jgi:hypothetical protein
LDERLDLLEAGKLCRGEKQGVGVTAKLLRPIAGPFRQGLSVPNGLLVEVHHSQIRQGLGPLLELERTPLLGRPVAEVAQQTPCKDHVAV